MHSGINQKQTHRKYQHQIYPGNPNLQRNPANEGLFFASADQKTVTSYNYAKPGRFIHRENMVGNKQI